MADFADTPEDFVAKWGRETREALQRLVDPICDKIRRREVTETEARELIVQARLQASFLIPGQMDLYDLIYESRFERLIEQFLKS